MESSKLQHSETLYSNTSRACIMVAKQIYVFTQTHFISDYYSCLCNLLNASSPLTLSLSLYIIYKYINVDSIP